MNDINPASHPVSVQMYLSLKREQVNNLSQSLEEAFNVPLHQKVLNAPAIEDAITEILLWEATLYDNPALDKHTIREKIAQCFWDCHGLKKEVAVKVVK